MKNDVSRVTRGGRDRARGSIDFSHRRGIEFLRRNLSVWYDDRFAAFSASERAPLAVRKLAVSLEVGLIKPGNV